MTADNHAKVQHFEVLFIGAPMTPHELSEVIESGLDERFTRAGHRRLGEWQLEVAALDAEEAHLG